MTTQSIKWYWCKFQMDWGFFVMFGLSLILIVWFLIAAWLYESVWILVFALLMIALDCFKFSMFMMCSYGLDDAHLIFRHGFMRYRMPFSEIYEILTSIKPRRLVIIYSKFKQKREIASPEDLNGFFDELAKRPGFQRNGDRVVKREAIPVFES
jgi:hypothetical protein